jgi:hypothetical protein
MRRLLILPLVSVALAACGGDEAQQEQRSEADQPCPEGTPSVSAADVVGPTPDGYVVDRGDQQAIGEFAGRISDSIGTTMRDHDGAVLARRGASVGTVVLVVNATRRVPSDEHVIRSMTNSEEQLAVTGENITIGGAEGRLSHALDGSFVATARAGECALVMLVDNRERRLRNAAAVVANDG